MGGPVAGPWWVLTAEERLLCRMTSGGEEAEHGWRQPEPRWVPRARSHQGCGDLMGHVTLNPGLPVCNPRSCCVPRGCCVMSTSDFMGLFSWLDEEGPVRNTFWLCLSLTLTLDKPLKLFARQKDRTFRPLRSLSDANPCVPRCLECVLHMVKAVGWKQPGIEIENSHFTGGETEAARTGLLCLPPPAPRPRQRAPKWQAWSRVHTQAPHFWGCPRGPGAGTPEKTDMA